MDAERSYSKLLLSVLLVGLMLTTGYMLLSGKHSSEISKNELNAEQPYENSALSISRDELESELYTVAAPLHNIGPINSLLISQRGELVAEQYYGSMNASRGNNIKSASKSVLSILVGIAIDQGYLEGVDQAIEEFFPEYFSSNPDSVKASGSSAG